MPRTKAALVPLFLATALLPATLGAQTMNGAVPGSLQFVQGQANIDGQAISTNTTGRPARLLHTGETLATANGSVDILMAPGALLRLGEDTTVNMVAAGPGRTELRLEQGRANISVNLVRDNDLLLLDMPNGQIQILSRGLYTFNTAENTVRVFNGEAYVFRGADMTSDVKPVTLKESHEIILGGDKAKPESFDRETADADLLPWTGPKESQAVLAGAGMPRTSYADYGYSGGYPGDYGFYGDGAYGYPYDAYGYPWGPYGFWGYPFFGVGFGFWGGGFYGGYPLRGRIGHGYGGYGGGGYGHGYAGYGHGYAAGGHAFAGGGGSFHGGGFGGSHGGGGHR